MVALINNGRGSSGKPSESDGDASLESPIARARRAAKMFQDFNRGQHKSLHAFLAEAALTVTGFKDKPADLEQFMKENGRKPPKDPSKSNEVLICLTGAVSRDARRQAGKYARAIDYMIATKVNDYEAYLNRLGYEKIVEAARGNNPKARAQRDDDGPFIKVYLSPREHEKLELILAHCPSAVEFELSCVTTAGSKKSIEGHLYPVTKVDAVPVSKLEVSEFQKRRPKMLAAEKQLVKDAKSIAASKRTKKEGQLGD